MKKVLCIALVMIVSTLSLGCNDYSPSPLSSRPQVLINYIEEEIIIYIHGGDEIVYSNITIEINSTDVISKENRYCAEYSTNLTEFTLEVIVVDDEKVYEYASSLKVRKENGVVIEIDEGGDVKEVREDELPYIKIMVMRE